MFNSLKSVSKNKANLKGSCLQLPRQLAKSGVWETWEYPAHRELWTKSHSSASTGQWQPQDFPDPLSTLEDKQSRPLFPMLFSQDCFLFNRILS